MNYIKTKKRIYILCIICYAILLLLISLKYPLGFYKEEVMRYQIPKYIFEHGKLPTAYDTSLYDPNYGFSYATSAPGSFVIEALFMKLFSLIGVSNGYI